MLKVRLSKVLLELLLMLTCTISLGCKNVAGEKEEKPKIISERVEPRVSINNNVPKIPVPKDMVWIAGGTFMQGAIADDNMAMAHEKPAHKVSIDGFFIDKHEVTNHQFSKFIDATGYITIAERKIDWEEMKKQLPAGTPKPPDSILQPGSLVFKKTKSSVPNLYDYSQWWEWKIGANWKHPNGPQSSIEGKENHPVVHIAYEDALAYCEWANRRLPTEAEWEFAARAGNADAHFFWGNNHNQLSEFANTWEGEFPITNSVEDGFERIAPVMQYPENNFGLYDMAGNVWEWTSDWYNSNYYNEIAAQHSFNPFGAKQPYNASNPYAKERVIKGGSFLCSASYCASYRISARMATSPDSSMEHLGFRTVATEEMLVNK